MRRIKDVPAGEKFTLTDLIDGERRETYYQRLEGVDDGRFVPTLLFGFRQWNRDGELRREDIGPGTRQMTDGLTPVQ